MNKPTQGDVVEKDKAEYLGDATNSQHKGALWWAGCCDPYLGQIASESLKKRGGLIKDTIGKIRNLFGSRPGQ